jgi:hypothetical protein
VGGVLVTPREEIEQRVWITEYQTRSGQGLPCSDPKACADAALAAFREAFPLPSADRMANAQKAIAALSPVERDALFSSRRPGYY